MIVLPSRFALRSKALATACAFAYPLVAHTAALRGSVAWVMAAIVLLAASLLLPALMRGNGVAWTVVPIVAAGCWALQKVATPVLPLYVAPVLVPTFMAWVFGHTLLSGETPLIEQLVRLLHSGSDEPEAAVWPYARRLTLAWTIFFICLACTNLLLAALADPDGLLMAHGVRPAITVPQYWWSLFANLIAYLLVAAFLVIEYAYRRHRFPQQPFRNFYDFAKQASAAMPKLLRRDADEL